MKKILNVLHNISIAIWPIVYLYFIGFIEVKFKDVVSRTFDVSYYYWLWSAIVVSGVIFAVLSVVGKKGLERLDRVIAYVVSGSIVFVVTLLYVGSLYGILRIHPSIYFIDYKNLLFVFGYTLFIAIKAVITYRRMHKEKLAILTEE